MALILEIRDRRGTTTWHPLNGSMVTVGRGLSNDIILDDPYVDAQHARIAPDAAGAWTISDLGSLNGVLSDGARATTSLALQPGVELKLGRTTLRVRDRDEALPPAIRESSVDAPRVLQRILTPSGSWTVIGATVAFTALVTWLGATERAKGTLVFSAMIGVVVLLSIWSGIWAAVVRGADRRFHMRSHLAVASAAALVTVGFSVANEWLTFLLPDAMAVSVLFMVVSLTALAAVVVGHLTVAGSLTERLRWRAGLTVAGVLLALIFAGAAVSDDKFSDVPKFPAQLKPMPPALVPTSSVDQFVEAMRDARSEADDAIKR
jgi:pSer/pThr/pTyr-binding forkhead associated (FHA) protein